MPDEALVVIDFDSAEPQILAAGQAVHIITHAGTCLAHILPPVAVEIRRQSVFLQALVTIHHRNHMTCRFENLCIIACIPIGGKPVVRSHELCKVEGLRCLNAPQAVAIDGPVQVLVSQLNHRINTGQYRDCRRFTFEGNKQVIDYAIRNKRPCGIVYKNIFGATALPDCLQAIIYRLLARCPADNDAIAGYRGKGLAKLLLLTLADYDPDVVDSGVGQEPFDAMADHGLAVDLFKLFGKAQPSPCTDSGCHDQRMGSLGRISGFDHGSRSTR